MDDLDISKAHVHLLQYGNVVMPSVVILLLHSYNSTGSECRLPLAISRDCLLFLHHVPMIFHMTEPKFPPERPAMQRLFQTIPPRLSNYTGFGSNLVISISSLATLTLLPNSSTPSSKSGGSCLSICLLSCADEAPPPKKIG